VNLDGTRLPFELELSGAHRRPRHEILALAWIADQRSPATRRSYGGMIRRWFNWLAEHGLDDPLEARRWHVATYQRHLESLDRAPGTIAAYLTAISSFYGYCVEEADLLANPVAKVKRPRTSDRLSPGRAWLPRPQLNDILEGARQLGPTPHALLCVLGYNGLRIAEACSLNIEWLEHRGPYTEIEFTRKGGKRGRATFAVRTQFAVMEAIGDRTEGPIFVHSYGGRMNQKAAQRIIDKAVKNVRGEHGRITNHSLRHSWATIAAQAGVPLDQLRVDGGWSDLRTPGSYAHGSNNPAAAATHAVAALTEGAL
jgi:integrase/recombinase XerD